MTHDSLYAPASMSIGMDMYWLYSTRYPSLGPLADSTLEKRDVSRNLQSMIDILTTGPYL